MNDADQEPFAARCRDLHPTAAFSWLARGWADYRRSTRVSLVYGGFIVAISLGVSALAWWLGRYVLVLAMLSGFVFITFAASAFALPMIVDRDVDTITACITSVNAVLRNKPAMVIWAGLIVGMTALGFLTLGLGLAAVIPLLAYATYHGYLDTIDGSEWPEATSD